MAESPPLSAGDVLSFDEFVDWLRETLGVADAVKDSELHSFRELAANAGYSDVVPDHWYQEAFDELEAQGHLDPASSKVMGDAVARLSADGRLYLRESSP